MEKRQELYNKVIPVLLIACVVILSVFGGRYVPTAYADEIDSVQERYEQTNVLNNLKGSTIGGKQFDIKDYPHNSNAKPQIISFVEFCYSYYAEKQDDYGLYIYLYNPQDTAFDTNTTRNKIQLSYGKNPSYSKYSLTFLNYSTEAGIEGRFYKFKINLSDADKTNILKGLSPDERVYKVSGIELSVKSKVTEHATAQTYTYKGFAVGYGSELAETDTLSCTVDGFDKYLSLDIRSTYWRPKGTHADGYTRDTLHSVYFSVPNSIINEYGEMTAVHATWLNAYTAPMLITGNKSVYNAIEPLLGKYIHGGTREEQNPNTGLQFAVIATMAAEGLRDDVDMAPYGGYYALNPYFGYDSGQTNYMDSYKNLVTYLHYLFYADGGNADTYTLPAEKLIGDKSKGITGWFESYTKKHGGALVNDRFSADLFEKTDDLFTDVNIQSTDEYSLTDKIVSDTVWNRLFGSTVKHENSYTLSAIQKVTVADISQTTDKSLFCEKFFISEGDYTDFTEYVRMAAAKQETTYLFRYYQSEYVSNEATEYKRVNEWFLIGGDYGVYEYVDTNAFFAQMWVQLDFDIIDLTFTKDGVITVIPIIMSPMDIAADAEHPVSTQPEPGLKWWQIVLGILLVILIIFLLLKFAPGVITVIVKVLLFIITLPFKLLGAIFKPIHAKAKASRERHKQERAVEKEHKRMEKAQRAIDEKARKEQKKKNKEISKRAAKRQKRIDKQRRKQDRADERNIYRYVPRDEYDALYEEAYEQYYADVSYETIAEIEREEYAEAMAIRDMDELVKSRKKQKHRQKDKGGR